MEYDLIVVGLGVMGLSTVYQAQRATRGLRVVGLEQFGLLHDRGSSHGESRLTRQAYSEGVMYVPMMLDAHREWDLLSHKAGRPLLHRSGVVYVSCDEQSEVIQGALASAKAYNLPGVELLDAQQALGGPRFPGMRGEAGEVALWEAGAGWLEADAIRETLYRVAVEQGAELRFDTPVVDWQALGDGRVCVTLRGGERVFGRSLVLTAGAWTQRFVPGLTLRPHRAVLSWFEVEPASVQERARGPGFMLERRDHVFIYGFPAVKDAEGRWLVKTAFHYAPNLTKLEPGTSADCDPDTVNRTVSEDEVRDVERAVRSLFRGLGRRVKSKTCLYNNSADCHFVMDRHPVHRNVVIASGFSGHGFKFGVTIGKVLAALARGEDPGFDISPFRLRRPGVFEHSRL